MRPHRRNTAHVKYPYIKDFSKFSKISIFGLLNIASYTVVCQDFHCGKDSTKQMTVYDQITFFIKKSILFSRFFEGAKNLGKYNTIEPKTQIYRGFLGRRHQAGAYKNIMLENVEGRLE